ncbi:hypothetical protein A3J43_02160 [Candidatus Uhrbacteria bacterium RIFCSPHIGHO2_12_FULL_54_23]|uniref:SCP domain-containing protein n=3 Tax=Candidatus Uhriibacteriota TaxID=1752732 RepID=A0A1F7ULW3_9BACT|nr:MAG: hypothetical protein A3J43_02160 [Candidatus Uhrbacteria bacterium RIFCSPHIGHO2_12_FULL_54_23]OGL84412.1 MAG: hypothetical protein A3B36_02845 [Candidatus Uhrbacteria bacterium RIFCSPLOWO2_01_FULL_55_36]OGL90461.1 MAG: hypothetical protein A3J36_00800 [Candidatus Uhrbacteria bacterium RIFCSPLOWO2_02_FULL_54_37]
MKLFLRIFVTLSLVGWAAAGWIWREEIGARVAAWRGSERAVELVDRAEQRAAEAVSRTAEEWSGAVVEIAKEVRLPEPLRARVESPRAMLTVAGVAAETNAHRRQQGLGSLKLNAALSRAALSKAQDMLIRQYFAHDSPEGIGAADLIESAGYAYITIGENLALGNYENDAVLVQAWMDSPGHRENILNGRFTEIGVAVVKGIYEGEQTWMAVQEFGKPLSDCPAVEGGLQQEIARQEATLNAQGSRIESLKEELDRARPQEQSTQAEVDAYNAHVEEHNRLVKEYNALRDALQDLISRYNGQIHAHNVCVEQG